MNPNTTPRQHTHPKIAEIELTSAERLAHALQQSLAPQPPELLSELSDAVRHTIATVVAHAESAPRPAPGEKDAAVEGLIRTVLGAVRNLLYISAPRSGYIPSDIVPSQELDPGLSSAAQTVLQPAQRKVTTTLARLVLSVHALQHAWPAMAPEEEVPNRVREDTEQLLQAAIAYEMEVQKLMSLNPQDRPARVGMKRLKGVFTTANIGLGLVGGGAAGAWKGFGWVPLEPPAEEPNQILGTETISEVGGKIAGVEEELVILGETLKNSREGSGMSVLPSLPHLF